MNIQTSSEFNAMVFTLIQAHPGVSEGKIIPTSIIIKNLHNKWTTNYLLQLISQLHLPKPTALNLLYDHCQISRGMAFATFASADATKRVIQKLDAYRLDGRRLNVQYKRERLVTVIGGDKLPQKVASSSHAQAEPSVATKPRRGTPPPSESYALLMSYQKHPVEKEKLKQFLVETGDYQEAVNEFCKNRARETLAGIFPGVVQEVPPLDQQPTTLGEGEHMNGLEEQAGVGGGVSREVLEAEEGGGSAGGDKNFNGNGVEIDKKVEAKEAEVEKKW